ncbi:MAG TPA: permease [Pontiella sp.]
MMDYLQNIAVEIWQLTLAMAPYLLFGFLMAGILSELISKDFVRRHLGGRKWMQSVKAALFGVPMPICSCGVIPLAASLREQGASRGATASFLASTPQTGVDSLMVTHALLGLPFAIARAVIAFLTGIFCGTAVEAVSPRTETAPPAPPQQAEPIERKNVLQTLKKMMHYGFISLPENISQAMLFGIFLSGVISSLIPANYFADKIGSSWTAMLLMLLIGLPLYVCSSASVPIALAFIRAGISPGAALVFLIVGPATNAATLSTLWNILGRRQLAAFLGALTATALGAGILLNRLPFTATLPEQCGCHTQGLPPLVQLLMALLLIAVLANGIIRSAKNSREKQ